jgi:hypothetical protein
VTLKGELMTTFHIPSPLETSISNFYLENNLTQPKNLDEMVIGKLFNEIQSKVPFLKNSMEF